MERSVLFVMSVISTLTIFVSLTYPGLSAALAGSIERLSAIGTPVPEARNAKHVAGEVIVRFEPGVVELPEGGIGRLEAICDESLRRLAQRYQIFQVKRVFRDAKPYPEEVVSATGEVVVLNNVWDVYLLRFPEELDVWEVVDSLRSYPQCIYAEPNFVVEMMRVPNDSVFIEQWSLPRIAMPNTWEDEVGKPAVKIGILDTGVDYFHRELGSGFGPGYKVEGGWDYVNNDSDPRDDNNHGTHVAGIASAITNNQRGIAGVSGGWMPGNRGCTLYSLKVLSMYGGGSSDKVAQAVREAWPRFGVRIINASFGGYHWSETERGAILDAHKCGVVFVAAKGNDGTSKFVAPADYDCDWVISVGASNDRLRWDDIPERRVHKSDWDRWGDYYGWSSNYGNGMDVLAPGVKIKSTIRMNQGSGYDVYEGTSMAAPHVTGIAALILSKIHSTDMDSVLSVNDIEGLVCASCRDITSDREGGEGLYGYDQWSGWGRVCADSVMKFLGFPYSPYTINHCEAIGGYTVGSPVNVKMAFLGTGPLVPGIYYCKRYDVRCDVIYPYTYFRFPHVWGRGYGKTTGWSCANPNYQVGFCMVVNGSQTMTGCQLRTWVYQVWNVSGQYLGWYPCRPEEVLFGYTVLGVTRPPDSGVDELKMGSIALGPVIPNPARVHSSLLLELNAPSEVRISIYDVEGKEVKVLMDGSCDSGKRLVEWDGADALGKKVASGVYLFRVEVGNYVATRKVVMLR